MRKKGLVYRATTLLGLSIIFFQFGGEVIYAKYFRKDRDLMLEHEHQTEARKARLASGDEPTDEDIDAEKKKGLF